MQQAHKARATAGLFLQGLFEKSLRFLETMGA
jgi:hypothetical protein